MSRKNCLLFYIIIISMINIQSCAQENSNREGSQSILLEEEMESQDNFFDALRERTDLGFDTNKRLSLIHI